METKTIRTSKKKEWINGLEHDIKYYEDSINEKGSVFFWHHGTKVMKWKARVILAEMKEELKKVLEDKNYKPWKPDLKDLGTTFSVLDALRGRITGDYTKDLKRLNRSGYMCSAALYQDAYQLDQQQ